MGWCHEFGPQIHEGCDHPMIAGRTSCSCVVCGTECTGRFNGCPDVWARGPVKAPARAVRAAPVVVDAPLLSPEPLPWAPAAATVPVLAPEPELVADATSFLGPSYRPPRVPDVSKLQQRLSALRGELHSLDASVRARSTARRSAASESA